tara:strand:+ start:1202 stop:1387 length:186 start_codon:yes stop_codon:yes gene_type:complete
MSDFISTAKRHATPERVNWLKQKARDSWEFIKDNPNEIMLGLITLAVFDIEDDIDDIEDQI